MAFVGLQYAAAAKFSTHTEGAAPTYTDGKVIGKMMQANITWDRSDNPLYADDTIAENDNSITGGSIELGLDDLSDEDRAYLFGDDKTTSGTGTTVTTYENSDVAAPYVGFGYVRVRVKGGVTNYQGNWIHKAQFGETSETATTKGQSIEWQTPTMTGRIFGVKNDSTMHNHYRQRQNFAALSDAIAWVKGKAGIT